MTPNEAKERILKNRSFDVVWRGVTFHLVLPAERVVRRIIRENSGNNDAIEREMLRSGLSGWDGMSERVILGSQAEKSDSVAFEIGLALEWLDENMEASDVLCAEMVARWNTRTQEREDAAKNSKSASTTNEIETRHAA